MAIHQLERLSGGDKPFALFLFLGTPHPPWVPENVPGKYLEPWITANISAPMDGTTKIFFMREINDTFEPCTWYEKNWTKDRVVLRTATSSC
ncbi:MAG: hypothetical protein LBC62_05660 [Treponema sp.]|nr:hypothetical protein [Treponema sp.]